MVCHFTMPLQLASRHSGGAAVAMVTRNGYIAGDAVERDGALVRFRSQDHGAAARRRAIAVERDGRRVREIGRCAVQQERLLCQVNGVNGVRLVQDFYARQRIGGI